MRSILTAHQSRPSPKKPAGVVKVNNRDPKKPSRKLRSLAKHFWYASPDGTTRLVTSSSKLNEIPKQIDDYIFHATKFRHDDHPSTFHPGAVWPPTKPGELMLAIGSECNQCVGNTHFNSAVCKNRRCKHDFSRWKASIANWQDYFELRKTTGRGLGVYTKRPFYQNDILGWYAGEIIPSHTMDKKNDYLMEVPLGVVSDLDDPNTSDADSDTNYLGRAHESPSTAFVTGDVTVMIDAQRQGNWTRFINHSCEPHTDFRVCRVGDMRIIAVEAVKHIPAGAELTTNYGEDYYGPKTKKICYCGTAKCVRKGRVGQKSR